MKVLSCTFIILATLALSTCSSSSTTRQVLKFGNTVQDYVMFMPNMGYFTSQLSLCSWVKKLKTDSSLYLFHYRTTSSGGEIYISDDGYSLMFGSHRLSKANQLGITPGTWYHYCLCWSYSSRTADVYHNGRKIGSFSTPSGRRLYTGGTLVLGQRQYPYVGRIYTTYGNLYTFGGELFKLNMFSKKFTAAEVRAMYQAGICSEAEKIHGSYRRLTWESILQQTRHGNVQLVNVDITELDRSCQIQENLVSVENQLAEARRELETVKEQLNRKETEISEMRQRAALTTEKLDQTQTELNKTKADLGVTQSDLNHTQTELNKTKVDLKETLSDLTKTQTNLNATKADLEQRLNISKSEFRRTQADLGVTRSDLTQTQTELTKTKADLGVTQSDLTQTQTELNKTKADLGVTKSDLTKTQTELNKTKIDLGVTQSDLTKTQTELNTTKADLEQRLNKTQNELRTTQADSEMYKSRISETEIFSANMSRELENTKNKLEATRSELGLTKRELNLTKTELNLTKEDVEEIETNLFETRKNLEASLNETRTDLDEMLENQFNQNKKRQEKITQDLDMLKAQLEKTKHRLNQTLAGLEEQISDIPDCEVAAANVSRELAATKLELDRKEEELERLRGGMSGENSLGEASCSHWDILYNHCYFNNVLTEEKFMSLNKVWEKLGK